MPIPQANRRRRWIGLSTVVSFSVHFGVLTGLTFMQRPALPTGSGKDKEAAPIEITFEEIPPVPPEEIPPEDLPPVEGDVDPGAVAAASLPEPPATLQLASAITQRVDFRPPVPPRPDSLLSANLPVRRGTGGAGGTGAGGIPNVFSVAQLDRTPTFRVQIPPTYPPELRRAGVSGQAEVRFVVDESGTVIEARVISTTHPEFGQASVDAIRRWRARPGTKDGRPVKFQMIIPMVFNVNETT